MARYPEDDYDRDIVDIIPERYEDVDADSRQARAGYRMRSYLTLGAAVVAVGGIVAAGLHFMNGKQSGGAGVQVIRADERPIKIRPTDPGGMQVPNQDKLIYERMEGESESSKVERLLPSPEQPQIPVKTPDSHAPKPPPTAEILRPGTPMAAKPPLGDSTPNEPPAEPPLPNAHRPVAAAAHPVASKQTEQALPALAAPPPIGAPAAKTPPSSPAAPQAAPPAAKAQPVVAAPVKPPPPPPPPAPVPPKPAVAGGDWLIQLGALRSAADADREWGRIQRANADVLASLRSDVMRVDLPDKGTFYRLRAGPLSEASARQLCNDLKSRNQGCMIVRK